jgi:hypothetical protein
LQAALSPIPRPALVGHDPGLSRAKAQIGCRETSSPKKTHVADPGTGGAFGLKQKPGFGSSKTGTKHHRPNEAAGRGLFAHVATKRTAAILDNRA